MLFPGGGVDHLREILVSQHNKLRFWLEGWALKRFEAKPLTLSIYSTFSARSSHGSSIDATSDSMLLYALLFPSPSMPILEQYESYVTEL